MPQSRWFSATNSPFGKGGHFYYRLSTHSHRGSIYVGSRRRWRCFVALLIKMSPCRETSPDCGARIDPADHIHVLAMVDIVVFFLRNTRRWVFSVTWAWGAATTPTAVPDPPLRSRRESDGPGRLLGRFTSFLMQILVPQRS